MSIEQISDTFINQCKRSTNYQFLGRRFGTLSNESKSEIYKLEMSMCLEKKYMKCLQHVHDLNQTKQTDASTTLASPTTASSPNATVLRTSTLGSKPISSIEACEPLIHEYIGK